MREVLDGLEVTDRFLLRSFSDGLKVSEVARMLGEEQKPLYRRRENLLKSLRQQLEARGLTAAHVAEILDWGQAEMDFGLDRDRRRRGDRMTTVRQTLEPSPAVTPSWRRSPPSWTAGWPARSAAAWCSTSPAATTARSW